MVVLIQVLQVLHVVVQEEQVAVLTVLDIPVVIYLLQLTQQ